MDEDDIWSAGLQHGLEADEDARRQLMQCLSRSHEVEIVIGDDVEQLEDLIEHVAVLGCDTDDALNSLGGLECLDHRSHLDRLRAGPKDGEDANGCSDAHRNTPQVSMTILPSRWLRARLRKER